MRRSMGEQGVMNHAPTEHGRPERACPEPNAALDGRAGRDESRPYSLHHGSAIVPGEFFLLI